jgi:DNA primase
MKAVGHAIAAELDRLKNNISLSGLIARDIPLRRSGAYRIGLCPFHSERTPSFYVLPDDRRFRCFGCGAHGDAVDYIQRTRGVAFLDAVTQLRGGDYIPPMPIKHYLSIDVPQQVVHLWNEANDTFLAVFYLRSRGLLRPGRGLPTALRGHASVLYSEPCGDDKPIVETEWHTWRDGGGQWWKGIRKPALLAAVSDQDGRITGLQRIWCERRYEVGGDGPKDARARGLSARKKVIGRLGAGAVRLAPAGVTLGLAEGVESALAASLLFRIPVWATCGAGRLGAVALPDCVCRVLIFGDRGDAGERAAEKAAGHYCATRWCDIVLPQPQFGDWCDALLGTQA